MNPLLLLISALVATARTVTGLKPIDVYWNISNPIFSGGYGEDYENVIEVNRDTHPWEYDQVNIICPSGENSTERHIIYAVDKIEYDNCRIINPKPRIIAVCDQPRNFMYFTITFRSFSPSPMQMEFQPGQSYYFISTSSDRDIHRRVGGWCSTKNMKMIFRVAENPLEENAVNHNVQNNPASAFWSKYWNSRVPDYRDSYTRDYSDYEYDDNRVGVVRTKSRIRNSRLDPRHVQMPRDDLEEFQRTNALRLQHTTTSGVSRNLLSSVLVHLILLGFFITQR